MMKPVPQSQSVEDRGEESATVLLNQFPELHKSYVVRSYNGQLPYTYLWLGHYYCSIMVIKLTL